MKADFRNVGGICLILAFLALSAAPARAEDLVLTASDLAALQKKAQQGRKDAREILERYEKQQAEAKTRAEAAAEAGVIGTVMEVEGKATITPEGQGSSAVAVNTRVHLNDMLETFSGARVMVLFIDNTEMTLSEKTKMTVDKWVFDPDDNTGNQGIYSVLSGAFLYVSGLISKKENPDVQINTPVGSIGIRGTEFWGGYLDSDFGIYVKEGQVDVKTDAGEVVVDKGQGTFVHDRESQPSAAKAWAPEKLNKAVATVQLKKPEIVRQRISGQQEQQKILAARYKEFMEEERLRQQQLRQQEQRQKNIPFRNDSGTAPSPPPPRQQGQQERLDELEQKRKQEQLEELKRIEQLQQLQKQQMYKNDMGIPLKGMY